MQSFSESKTTKEFKHLSKEKQNKTKQQQQEKSIMYQNID
jgi:hypothetical protein